MDDLLKRTQRVENKLKVLAEISLTFLFSSEAAEKNQKLLERIWENNLIRSRNHLLSVKEQSIAHSEKDIEDIESDLYAVDDLIDQ